MGIEESNGKKEIISPELKKRALSEMRESGKNPFPGKGSPEHILATIIAAGKEALNNPHLIRREDAPSVEDQLKAHRDTILSILESMGIEKDTRDLILQEIEEDRGKDSTH